MEIVYDITRIVFECSAIILVLSCIGILVLSFIGMSVENKICNTTFSEIVNILFYVGFIGVSIYMIIALIFP